jgi:UDP-3-O-[3-hydroxymyristoyl] glucosamine N-acyltransferase
MLLSELAARTGAALDGDGSVDVAAVASLGSAGPGTITFLVDVRRRDELVATRASAVIVPPAAVSATPLPKLVSRNPYATYAKVATILHAPAPATPGIHATAVVGAGARIAASASVGPYAVIGADATVGERTRIGALCTVGDRAELGDDVLLHPRVTVAHGCVIGARTIVHSGAVIGADGFGNAEEGGRWIKIPQIGRVVVGADVEIGANTTIDRGTLDDTVIEDGARLDNQIQIGHNCRIGAHTAIAACVGIAGSTRIGRSCKIGGAAMLNGHIDVCDGTIVSPATGVMRSIEKPGVYSGFWPSLPHAEWRRLVVAAQGLRALAARVRRLERGVAGGPAAPAGEEEDDG